MVGMSLFAACCASSSGSDLRTTVLEEHAKTMMIEEAQDGFRAQFGTTFDPAKTRLVVGPEVKAWCRDNHRVVSALPEPYDHTVAHGEQAALVIDDALPTKAGGRQSVLYLRPFRPGFKRWLVLGQPDPCGDGNPALCERCTGCEGGDDSGGLLKTCVCTLSCDDCVPCRPCSG